MKLNKEKHQFKIKSHAMIQTVMQVLNKLKWRTINLKLKPSQTKLSTNKSKLI